MPFCFISLLQPLLIIMGKIIRIILFILSKMFIWNVFVFCMKWEAHSQTTTLRNVPDIIKFVYI